MTHTLWILRKSNLPYGVSLWEIIRQNKTLYDKMKNMTMDQLVLSILKFGFFSGTNTAVGDGVMEIVPGQARQLTSSTGKPEINWMEIPGPGKDAWTGLEAVTKMMDSESGIVPTLEGEVTGKTLGEILHAKEAALKRIKVPVENIAWLIEQDAYLTLSWMSQVYAIPTVQEFADTAELQAFNQSNEMKQSQLFATKQPDGTLTGPYEAHYLPQMALHLEDSDGQLVESKESKFFQVGTDIKPGQLRWKGIFKVIPRSIVDNSQTLVKAAKSEIFNMLVPLLSQDPKIAAKPASQILKVWEEDPEDWLPDSWIQYLDSGQLPPPPPGAAPGGPNSPAGATQDAGTQPPGAPGAPNPAPSGTIQAATGMTPPQGATIVPGSMSPSVQQLLGGKPGQLFKK